MARFFIDRPIFAFVIAIVLMLAGVLAILSLPVAQYPAIAAPTVTISATFPGASAKTLEDTVTQVIEQKINGIDNLRYLASTSDSAGNVAITLTFESEANPDIAQVQVTGEAGVQAVATVAPPHAAAVDIGGQERNRRVGAERRCAGARRQIDVVGRVLGH